MPRGFYAGLVRGKRKAFLLGPFLTKEDADRHVPRAREEAERIDPFCHFDSAGVFELEAARLPSGALNSRLK